MPWLSQTDDGVVLRVRVSPRSSKTGVQGEYGDELKIRLQSPPVDGKANKALLKFLAEKLGTAPGCLELRSGERGRSKRILVRGLGCEDIRRKLT
ncbi:hypothetical protein L21SP4_01839 [Kiritimatiella glycovorans]|uniref:UPF0235 protein L21SP4_01839 n=2 Tax=Kiritimatiella glycovorans TaxID=1307763 RepID=A0A0G3EF42_9BACT|nr:hypothetical protein L21SP4_01839 [Kiritimatiella glycovorans]